MISVVLGILERSLIFSLVVVGVYLTSVILKFDDLTVKGSFSLGGAITACCFLSGLHFLAALILAMLSGALCGLATGLFYTIFKFNGIISGIVVTSGIFSINLKLCYSLSTVPLIESATIFNIMPCALDAEKGIIILFPIAYGAIKLVQWLLKTEVGLLVWAVGENPTMLCRIGKRPALYIVLTLMLSNALAGLAGSLFAQYMGHFSIFGHIGVLLTALASLLLAHIVNQDFNFLLLLGAIAYQCIIALSFEFHLDQDLNHLLSAFLVVVLVAIVKNLKIIKGFLGIDKIST